MNAIYERSSLDDALTHAHLKVGSIESALKCLQKYCWENYEIEWPVVTDMVDVLSACAKDVDKQITLAEDAVKPRPSPLASLNI